MSCFSPFIIPLIALLYALCAVLVDQVFVVNLMKTKLNWSWFVAILLIFVLHLGAETVSEPWCIDILKAIMAATPHKWPQQTLACFPPSFQDFYQHHQTGERHLWMTFKLVSGIE